MPRSQDDLGLFTGLVVLAKAGVVLLHLWWNTKPLKFFVWLDGISLR